MQRKRIIIVGGGPAGMMAADVLSREHDVSIFEKEKSIGQKFLVAGKGGLNITNSAIGEKLDSNYSPKNFLTNSLNAFDSIALREWLSGLSVPTFVGSSGRVFPEEPLRPVDVLNKIKAKLIQQGAQIFTRHQFISFDGQHGIIFNHQGKEVALTADYIVFALGGASWPITGSNGEWTNVFGERGIKILPFEASNCGINIHWPETFKQSHAGKPLKNIRLFTSESDIMGEAMITDYGLEGNAVYPMVPSVRNILKQKGSASLCIDFKPANTKEQLLQKVKGKDVSTKDYGAIFNLNSVQLALIKAFTNKDSYLSVTGFIQSLKELSIPVHSLRPMEEAISTIGGIDTDELNEDFSLKKYPWIYTIGEMVDWDAPTGGFLLQGCFAMANYAAKSIVLK